MTYLLVTIIQHIKSCIIATLCYLTWEGLLLEDDNTQMIMKQPGIKLKNREIRPFFFYKLKKDSKENPQNFELES